MPAARAGACVFLTGATGFLGKVTLSELLRQHQLGPVDRVFVLVRGKRGKTPKERFAEMTGSACFAPLAHNWQARVTAIAGNLHEEGLGLAADDLAAVTREVTHVVHCAASVDFDLPLGQACQSNILASLNLLALARQCTRLVRMVAVSTAYVTPHHPGPIAAELVPLPEDPARLLARMLAEGASKGEVLAATGHPNTYTLTKCVAEHLLMQQRGDVPLTIVRPSIISAAVRYPSPGWIDSSAALAGFVIGIGAGAMRVVNGAPATKLDVVPVDRVAACILNEALAPADHRPARIVHATAGLQAAASVARWVHAIEKFFGHYPVSRRAHIHYLGGDSWRYRLRWWWHQALPAAVLQRLHHWRGQRAQGRGVRRALEKVAAINRVFPYFTHQSFDFQCASLNPPAGDADRYLEQVCRGVYRHLMGLDPQRVPLGGRLVQPRPSALAWALSRPGGSLLHRLAAWALTQVMARVFDEVSVDQESFENARERVAGLATPDSLLVVVPSHRSFADFLACSYLFFAKPHLGVAIPHVAAAEDFARIPLVGPLFRMLGAFFIRRGGRGRDPALAGQVDELVRRRITLEFFIEGKRSRTRHFLAPRRGMLRCLQAGKRPFILLPVALSYDRVPEEEAFADELAGQPAAPMRLMPLLRWLGTMVSGRVELGRLHVACAEPVAMTPRCSVHQVGDEVAAQLQAQTTITDFHLRQFAAAHPGSDCSPAWLKEAIEARGGIVLPSRLPAATVPGDRRELTRSLQHQWEHHFFSDAEAVAPGHPALGHYLRAHAWAPLPLAVAITDARLDALLTLLFRPVCDHTAQLATALARGVGGRRLELNERALIARAGCPDWTLAVSGIEALAALGVVRRNAGGTLTVLAGAERFRRLAWQCQWRPRRRGQPLAPAGERPLTEAAPA